VLAQPPSFVIGCWKVSTTVHLQTAERVSLWVLDQGLRGKGLPNAADQAPYIQGYSASIRKARPLCHPHVLKVLEVVTRCLKGLVGKADSTDASYFAWQPVRMV
jgi:hypothetical protein